MKEYIDYCINVIAWRHTKNRVCRNVTISYVTANWQLCYGKL